MTEKGGWTLESVNSLGQVNGVVLRQMTQKGEFLAQAVGLPFEARNRYAMAPLPANAQMGKTKDTISYTPTNPEVCNLVKKPGGIAAEESSCMMRTLFTLCACQNERPFKMNFMNPQSNQMAFSFDRPFKCGGCFGPCCLREINVLDQNGQMVSQALQDWSPYLVRCCEAAYCCAYRQNIYEGGNADQMSLKYKTNVHLFCCPGYHNNCCGATCLSNDILMDITDPEGNVVASIQRTYAGGEGEAGCMDSGFCRMCGKFSTYVIEFPKDASPASRAAILAAVYEFDFMLFEKGAGDE